jgi:hypothetical protein
MASQGPNQLRPKKALDKPQKEEANMTTHDSILTPYETYMISCLLEKCRESERTNEELPLPSFIYDIINSSILNINITKIYNSDDYKELNKRTLSHEDTVTFNHFKNIAAIHKCHDAGIYCDVKR